MELNFKRKKKNIENNSSTLSLSYSPSSSYMKKELSNPGPVSLVIK